MQYSKRNRIEGERMRFLAWYAMAITIIQVIDAIASSDYSGGERIGRVVFRLPIFIFFLYYLHII